MTRKGAGLTPYLFASAVVEQDVEALRALPVEARASWRPRLTVYAKALLWTIVQHADADGRAHLGTLRLQGETSMSARQVPRARRELVEAGLIEVERLGTGKRATEYRLVLTAVEGRHTVAPDSQAPLTTRRETDDSQAGQGRLPVTRNYTENSPSNYTPIPRGEKPVELPREPSGNRKRDLDRFAQEVEAYAADLFPSVAPDRFGRNPAADCVRQAITRAGARNRDDVLDFARVRWPNLLADDNVVELTGSGAR